MSQQLVFQLAGTCNQYPWGRRGRESLAATLCASTPGSDFEVEDDKNYSELWFGDYNDFPGRKLDTGELLADVLARNKEQLLGRKVIEDFDAQLPYLPKILSIAKALPLQLHPNKELANKLHQKDPSNFTDPNHKPEIAVALSKFEVFAGFKPLSEVAPLFKLQPLQQFNPDKSDRWSNATLRDVTRNMLKADLDTVKKVQTELSKIPRTDYGAAAYILDLLPRLQDQYGPEDAGSLVALLCMNYLVLNAGDAIFIPADGIHAYLSGDIVECMARSNNVLNVGFCPPADRNNVDIFADTLTFKAHSKSDVTLPSTKSAKSKEGKTVVYRPPISEFDMLKVDLGPGDSEEITASEGPGVLIVTSGEGVMQADRCEFPLKAGYIFFVAPGISVKWESQTGMQIHMAVI
ncbi:RmlC-like cupin domain-containing protein [Biscogniauxia marginata]|nr:RmlC-like cupin domain-containing protein [Biscogniauxia marginata]